MKRRRLTCETWRLSIENEPAQKNYKSKFRTMLFALGQSSNSDVDVGFPQGQRLDVRDFIGRRAVANVGFPRGQRLDVRDFVGRRAVVNFLLWLGFGVHLRSRPCSGSGLA